MAQGAVMEQTRVRPVKALLAQPDADREAIAARFEGLDLEGKIAEMLTLKTRDQARLWEVCAANAPLTISDLLLDDLDDSATWIWEGVNSLPLFRRFQKRVRKAGPETAAGYNEQSLRWLTGPGCFTARPCRADEPGSIVFDYTITPTLEMAGCSRILPADRGVSRLVYGGMLDYMHSASPDVLIGRAWCGGKATANYFLLARGPRA